MNFSLSQKIALSDTATERSGKQVTNLTEAEINQEYTIKEVKTDDEEMKNFLFTLGCYAGEEITIISILAENYVISIKDARYSIDQDLAKAIIIKD